jgi:hypothetical protein
MKPHESDVEPIHGYTIHYKPEFGDWETVQIAPTIEKYTLEKLLCGTRYQVYVKAYNRSVLIVPQEENRFNLFDL